MLKDFYLGKNKAGGANTASVTYSMLQQGPVGEAAPEVASGAYQALIDAELTSVIGAGPWERTDDRTALGPRRAARPRAESL